MRTGDVSSSRAGLVLRKVLRGIAARALGLGLVAGLLVAGGSPLTASAASVTVSNPVMSGTAPVKVGDYLSFSADLAVPSAAIGDSFTITLPPELAFTGALSFPLSSYGQCSWSGQTATCTFTKAVTNGVGGISLALAAAAVHSGNSTINIAGTSVTPVLPGGSIGAAPTGSGGGTYPAPIGSVKTYAGSASGWNNYTAQGGPAGIADWEVRTPAYSTATTVTIHDVLQSGNGFVAQHYYFGAYPAWDLGFYPVTSGNYSGSGYNSVGYWTSSTGIVPGATLIVSADLKSFDLTFIAQPGRMYVFHYYTVTDSPAVDGDQLLNTATINGDNRSAIIKIPTGSAWLRVDYGQFSVKKSIAGAAAGSVPVGTTFTVHYSYVDGSGTKVSKNLALPFDMTSQTSDWAPAGTPFTISEINLPTIPGVVWGDYSLTGTGVAKNADGTYTVTPAAGATVALTLSNVANTPPTPKIDIVKKDAAGNDADTTATSVDLTSKNGSTGLVFTITNNGTEDLTDVVVSDKVTAGTATVTGLTCDFSPLGGPSSGTTWAAGPFKVGASFTCTAQLDGVAPGVQHTDVASVTGIGITSKTPVNDDNPYNAVVTPKPSIDIVKKDAAGNDADTTATSVDLTSKGGSTGLVFTITNNGTEDLTDVVVSDKVTAGTATVTGLTCDFSPLGGPATGTTWAAGPFKVGTSFTCTAQLDGVVAGQQHTDVASVTGIGITSKIPVNDDNPYNATVVKPSIDIVKKDAAGNDADTTATSVDLTAKNGSTGLVFTITNNGTEDLTDVVVSDKVTAGSATVTGLTCDFSKLGGPATGTTWAAGPFRVGASFTCTAQLDGVAPGVQHTDLASVTGIGITSKIPVNDDNPYNAVVTPKPAVDIVKKDDAGNDADTAATSVDLTSKGGSTGLVFTITNNGTEDLTDVVVSDKVTAGTATVTGLTCDFSPLGGPATGTTWAAGPFKVGTSFTCTAQLDGVVAGEQHTDLASVTGIGITSKTPVSDENPYNATVVTPSIDIVKKDAAGNDADTTAASVDLTPKGGSTGLVFTITNNGTEDLTDVVVSDKVTAGSATVTGLTCDFSKLGGPATGTTWAAGPFRVGASFTCAAQLDGVLAGQQHTDLASVTGIGITSKTPVNDDNPYNAVVTPKPAVDIVKKDDAGNDADTADAAVDLTDSNGSTGLVFTITNSGSEDLSDVLVTDTVTAGTATVTGLTCDFSKLGGPSSGTTWATGPFKVGASFTCTAQLDGVVAGQQHTDVAKVTGIGVTSKTPVSDDNPYNAIVAEVSPAELAHTGAPALTGVAVLTVTTLILGAGLIIASRRKRG